MTGAHAQNYANYFIVSLRYVSSIGARLPLIGTCRRDCVGSSGWSMAEETGGKVSSRGNSDTVQVVE